QAVVHEEALNFIRNGETRRALAAEAVARARVDIASRGLTTTVIQDFYAIVSGQRRVANLQTNVAESQRFYDLTPQQEQGGEVPHSAVLQAKLDLQSRQRDLQDAQSTLEKATIALGVLIFPNLSVDYNVVDDLQQPVLLPPVAEAQAAAAATSPDIKAASA